MNAVANDGSLLDALLVKEKLGENEDGGRKSLIIYQKYLFFLPWCEYSVTGALGKSVYLYLFSVVANSPLIKNH